MENNQILYASRWARVFASLIDFIIQIVFVIASIVLMPIPENAFTIILPWVFIMAYDSVFLASSWRATPGQKIMHIHAGDLYDKKLTLERSLLRVLVMYAPFLPALALQLSPEYLHYKSFLPATGELFTNYKAYIVKAMQVEVPHEYKRVQELEDKFSSLANLIYFLFILTSLFRKDKATLYDLVSKVRIYKRA